MEYNKNLIRIANRIQDTLTKLRNNHYAEVLNRIEKLLDKMEELQVKSKLMRESLTHGWNFSAEECCNNLSRILNDVTHSTSHVQQLVDLPRKKVPMLSELGNELEQLMQEFEEVDINLAEGTISVETEPITLEEIYLGPFKIQLRLAMLSKLYTSPAYHVIALDPHPAATSEEVTHPHVSNEQLCEGDGSAAVRASLEDGRLYDFFTLVKSILNTYSPDSPYVAISEWEGISCYNCGYTCGSDNCYFCGSCDRDYCEECSLCCHECDETVCSGCVTSCSICDDSVCPNCVRTCSECGSYCCKSCMEGTICKDCQESEVENEQRNEPISTNTQCTNTNQPDTTPKEVNSTTEGAKPVGLEIQSCGLGEAGVLPG
jgi:hypothetical protein